MPHFRHSSLFLAVLFTCGAFGCTQTKTSETTSVIQAENKPESKLSDLGEFSVTSGTTREIDLSQFKKVWADVAYTGSGNSRQTLDIVLPNSGKPPYKTLVLLHGGAWSSGDKRSENLAPVFQATTQGYAVVSINYRLAGNAAWPAPLHDAKAAIRFLRANATKYQLDADTLVVWGVSTGGHLAQVLAATNNKPAFEDLKMGNPKQSSAVQGAVSWYGFSDLTSLGEDATAAANKLMGFNVRTEKRKVRTANPIELIDVDFPPILLVHGSDDPVVPYQQAENMRDKVNSVAGRPTAELITFEGAGHGDPIMKTTQNMMRYFSFVDKVMYQGNNPHRSNAFTDIKVKPAMAKQ